MATTKGAPPPADPTLHLPRILCLHGGGTNARIFRAQCRSLSRSLGPHFRLAYAEAPFATSTPGPDVLSVYADCGPFKRWLRWLPEHEAPPSDAEAVRALDAALAAAVRADDALGATGPWVALLGFSQGAKLAASLLFRQQVLADSKENKAAEAEKGKAGPAGSGSGTSTSANNNTTTTTTTTITDIHWRFAVVLAGRSPLVSLFEDASAFSSPLLSGAAQLELPGPPDPAEAARGRHVLRLPTIHVHGLADPGLRLHRELLDGYCDPAAARLVEWDGGHRVPLKAADVDPVVDQILAVARETGALSLG